MMNSFGAFVGLVLLAIKYFCAVCYCGLIWCSGYSLNQVDRVYLQANKTHVSMVTDLPCCISTLDLIP